MILHFGLIKMQIGRYFHLKQLVWN